MVLLIGVTDLPLTLALNNEAFCSFVSEKCFSLEAQSKPKELQVYLALLSH